MRGHKRAAKRCGSRCLRWYWVLSETGPDGKRRRPTSPVGYPTKKAAELARREELARRDQGITLVGGNLTVAGCIEQVLDHLATVRDPNTVHRYRQLLELHVNPSL